VRRGDASPLARLPAFGLRSALRAPLFDGRRVTGLAAGYSSQPAAFSLTHLARFERALRPLGPSLADRDSEAAPDPGPPQEVAAVLTDLADQLNSPLAAVAGYAQALSSLPAAELPAALEAIQSEALRAGRIVHDLLGSARTEPASLVSALEEREERAAGGRPRVLVVDDEESVRTLTAQVLGTSGYEATPAASAAEALALLEDSPFDAIVTDIRMPGMDGVAFHAEVVRRWPDLARRVVIVTGDAESDAVRDLCRRYALEAIEKPFRLEALRSALARALAAPASSEA
jgi:CheY-like chemotaxis protein